MNTSLWVVAISLALSACEKRSVESTRGPDQDPKQGDSGELRARKPGNPDLLRGVWQKLSDPDDGISPEERAKLEALGYVGGVESPPTRTNVVTHDTARAYGGTNFYVAGHGAEAFLVDMNGEILHRWQYDFDALQATAKPHDRKQFFWRRAHLFPNGDILAIYDGIALIKLDKDSRLLWEYGGHPHHDMCVDESGDIYVIARELTQIVPAVSKTHPLAEDHIVRLNAEGKEIRRVSIIDALQNGKQDDLIKRLGEIVDRLKGDVTHINSVEVLDGSLATRIPAFKRGNLLLSSPKIHTIMVLNFETAAIVWVLTGELANSIFRSQHHPTMLDNGNMLFFDNKGSPPHDKSYVYEFDPVTLNEAWVYSGTASKPFSSDCCGTCYRLPNGNTLITETQFGRAFEVTPYKSIVWEFVNPHRAGDHNEYIAQLFDLVRLGPDFPLDWLE